MLLFGQVPLPSLIEFIRAVRHNLAAGIPIRRVFQQQSERGPIAIRPIAQRISDEIEQGQSLESALEKEKKAFPPIFVSMTAVGEQTGNLPEILAELEKYFVLQQKLRRDFRSQMAWPVIELVAAIFVIAGMIYLMAILSPNSGFTPMGRIYSGTGGAARWLLHSFGSIGLLIGLYYLLTVKLKQKAKVDRILLWIPVVGPCVQAIALTRFCLALRLTMESGMGIASALRLSMQATGNAAYAADTDRVRSAVRGGEDLAVALGKSDHFPSDFLNIVATAEEAGSVPEVMRHQGEYYEEESTRRLTNLTRAASWGLYALIAVFIIFLIFRIYGTYISTVNEVAG